MKSLIEEASSIAKAVEKGWERAGKPYSFSVKVYELPEKNFLGMTSKYAKIGLFFTEEKNSQAQGSKAQTPRHKNATDERAERDRTTRSHDHRGSQTEKIAERHTLERASSKQNSVRPQRTTTPAKEASMLESTHNHPQEHPWTSEMIQWCTQWIEQSLSHMQLSHVQFSIKTSKNQVRIAFSEPLLPHAQQQIQLFKNLSYIIMACMRAKFKTEFKNTRVLLICE